jgi:hypothetical protein
MILLQSSNRRWSSIQSQEFTGLYAAIATLVCSSDVSSRVTVETDNTRPIFLDAFRDDTLIAMPQEIDDAIFGANADRYIREVA